MDEVTARTILVNDDAINRIDSRITFTSYLKQIAKSADLIRARGRSLSLRRGEGTHLGKLWVVLDPLVQVLIYALVFGLILNISRGISNYIGFLTIGVIFFGVVRSAFTDGATVMSRSKNLAASFRFPNAVLILASIYRNIIDSIAPVTICVIVALSFQKFEALSWNLFWTLPILVMTFILCSGVQFATSVLVGLIPDMRLVINLGLRGFFFVSGVFFEVSRFDTHPWLHNLVEYNPIYRILESLRSCILYGSAPSIDSISYLMAWALISLTIGMITFWKAENKHVFSR